MAGHSAERVPLARLPSGVELETTVHTYEGANDGPTLYVQAAQHGQEINGSEVLRRFHEEIDPAELAGEIVAVPVANPLTFDRVSYTTPEQLDSINPNMNRVWPGDEDGTLQERMAATLWEYATTADAIVDLHTGSPNMMTHVVFMEGDEESRALAEAFGTDLLLSEQAGDAADVEWSERDFGGKFRVAATRAGIPSITPELAHNKEVVENAVETGLTRLLNVCRELGMLRPSPTENGDRELARNHLGRVDAIDSGLFVVESNHELGDEVDAGERIGTLYDPATYDVLQEVETDRTGVLYALTREATVCGGGKLLSVALLRD
ncbi:succinylglutamate desuccinylase/aspartoacylase family protein [Haladaptatus pallidirubidus]|uniref:Succinylglutamate desuccinylase/aspartoacylase family protein n=1 Tax=Haladaptatus pallidirubidus TaxID=1008152 RepID=A0AAV3UDZ3_9EURY|nr:succinylglutamate desuccinylase/aspartoacylase family protein [Haladaptatus pallidirubidus]